MMIAVANIVTKLQTQPIKTMPFQLSPGREVKFTIIVYVESHTVTSVHS